ncbi:MAG: NADH:flavin oxidoreductase [Myxococcales bacterium]|nr:NADH:flavin oxidoreductase [Myxococcales bacterium]MCB9651371.1 NADH:flavin oxidoreductase [Deltaproteobacteria bacterium]
MITRLFEEVRLGPLLLENRSIRAAAFEGMAPGHHVSEALIDYHRAVAEGGVGMTTVAYAAVDRTGLSFPHQLWMRPEVVPELRRLTDAVHAAGAKVSIQLGHAGNMARRSVAGSRAMAPSARLNLYGPVWPRAMSDEDIATVTRSFGAATRLAAEAGFDAVEIHAGHGYLISQFLSPFTNRRRDRYGGALEGRMRFMQGIMHEVRAAAGAELAVLVKMNLRDGFPGGMELEDGVAVAEALEAAGADALVLSGGFVSRAPMYIMRGAMPMKEMSRRMTPWWLRTFAGAFGGWLVPEVPYEDCYFLEDARQVRAAVKLPLVYVGGVASRAAAEAVLAEGFDAIAMARALIREPDFIRRLEAEARAGADAPSRCDHCNVCAARIYTTTMACHHHPGAD